MNVGVYNTDSKKVLSMQLLKHEVETGKDLLEFVKGCDDKKVLNKIFKDAEYDEKISQDEELLESVGDDKELKDLLTEHMSLLTESKKAIEEKIKALEEKERAEKESEKGETEREDAEELDEIELSEEDAEELDEDEQEQEDAEELDEDEQEQEDAEELDEDEQEKNGEDREGKYADWDIMDTVMVGITTERGTLLDRILKAQMRYIIANTTALLYVLNTRPVPEMLKDLNQNREVFNAEMKIGMAIQLFAGRDRELRELAIIMTKSAKILITTLDIHLERYYAKQQEKGAEKSEETEKRDKGDKGDIEEERAAESVEKEAIEDTEKGESGEVIADTEEGKDNGNEDKKWWNLSPTDLKKAQEGQLTSAKNLGKMEKQQTQKPQKKWIDNDMYI